MSSDTSRVVQLAVQIGASLVLAVPAGAQTSPATITVPRLPRAPALEYFAGQDGHATDSSLAAERAAARHCAEGRRVVLRFPPIGIKDYADIVAAAEGAAA